MLKKRIRGIRLEILTKDLLRRQIRTQVRRTRLVRQRRFDSS